MRVFGSQPPSDLQNPLGRTECSARPADRDSRLSCRCLQRSASECPACQIYSASSVSGLPGWSQRPHSSAALEATRSNLVGPHFPASAERLQHHKHREFLVDNARGRNEVPRCAGARTCRSRPAEIERRGRQALFKSPTPWRKTRRKKKGNSLHARPGIAR